MSKVSSRLFKPVKLGRLELANRVALAPLTRFRADDDGVPLPIVPEYYSQRGTEPGTLLITEATAVSEQAIGYANTPGVWNDAQVAGWKKVADAVHKQGSHIYMQLWAMGRAGTKEVAAKYGKDVVSSSDVPIDENHATPRSLTEPEIEQLISDFATAAHNAVERAGFDGVEIHAANGYLIDQFTQDVSNKRTDGWGGSIEKRARFGLAVAKAVADRIGADRTGIRLSPWSRFQSMRMADPKPQFFYLVHELSKLRLAYLHLVDPRVDGSSDERFCQTDDNAFLVREWSHVGPVVLAGGQGSSVAGSSGSPDVVAFETVDRDHPDEDVIIAFGRWFISTPDIIYRLRKGLALNQYDRETFYKPLTPKGYTDYPFSDEYKNEHKGVVSVGGPSL